MTTERKTETLYELARRFGAEPWPQARAAAVSPGGILSSGESRELVVLSADNVGVLELEELYDQVELDDDVDDEDEDEREDEE